MMKNFKCLFAFTHFDLDVVEVKRLDLPSETDKARVYFWLVLDSSVDRVTALEFRSMSQEHGKEIRHFSNGHLQFDDFKGKFHFQGKDYPLNRYHPENISAIKLKRISDFLI